MTHSFKKAINCLMRAVKKRSWFSFSSLMSFVIYFVFKMCLKYKYLSFLTEAFSWKWFQIINHCVLIEKNSTITHNNNNKKLGKPFESFINYKFSIFLELWEMNENLGKRALDNLEVGYNLAFCTQLILKIIERFV